MRTGTSLGELVRELDETHYTVEQRDCSGCFESFESAADIWFEQLADIDGHDEIVADSFRDDLPDDYVEGLNICAEQAMESYEPCEYHV